MDIAALILSILALILGSAGFAAGCWATIQVLAWKRSTHTITHIKPVLEETRIEADVPQHVLDQLPSPPEKLTAEQYALWQRRQQQEDDFDSAVWEE